MSKYIREGDKVIAIAGNYKGKTGKVLHRNDEQVIVEGINLRKKHMKRTQQGPGRIIEMEKPIHVSNLKVVANDKPVKLKVRFNDQGEKELYYVDGGEAVFYRSVKKSKLK